MIYLQREKVEFTKTKKEFEEEYTTLLERMFNTFKEKGKTRDVGSPLHHRMSPASMLALAQAKMRRIESLISTEGWEGDEDYRDKIVEECCDVANYNLYVATLCQMLEKETKQ